MHNPPLSEATAPLVSAVPSLYTGDETLMAYLVIGLSLFLFVGTVILGLFKRLEAYQIVRLSSAILLVNAILLLVAIGYDQAQISPLFGLLAIIAGHMLTNNQPPAPPPPTAK